MEKSKTAAAPKNSLGGVKTLQWGKYVDRYGTVLVLLVLVVVAACLSDVFFTSRNLLNVLRQVSANGLLSIGLLFVILTSGMDISIGSMVGVCSVTMGLLYAPAEAAGPLAWMVRGLSAMVPKDSMAGLLVVVLILMVIGAVLGFINGFVICKANIQPFIMTIGTLSVYRGLALLMSGGKPVYMTPQTTAIAHTVGEGRVFGVPTQVIILAAFTLLAMFVLRKTTFGRYLRAIGGNQEAARVAGIPIDRFRIAAYMLCGGMAAIAAFTLTARTTTGEPNLGDSFEMDAIAACVIGGARLTGGIGTVGGTIIGAVIIGIVNNILNLTNVSAYYQYVVRGLIIVLAVVVRSVQKNK